MNDINSIKDRVRKLMALGAKDSGASEAEAETAMRMAMGLMAQHGIDQASLGVEKPTARMAMRVNRKLKPYEVHLVRAAGYLYGCQPLCWSNGTKGFAFIGRPDNTEAAEMTVLWLTQQVDAQYKLHLPRGLATTDFKAWADFYRTFKVACAGRVAERAADLVRNPHQIASDIKSTALVVGDYFKQLKAENAVVLSGMKVGKSRARGTSWGNGTDAGYRAGNMVKLHREVQQ